ncbi:hypothetical protein BGZ98_000255 [Dissophora globulifera]|nr:hypothetical protein BGZ98_000255 [Dissophora globulifera]
MTSYAGTRSSWFMRVSGQQTGDNQRKQNYRLLDDHDQELDTYLLAPNGREIIFSPQKGKPLGANQIRPPAKAYPTCFARAVVGMQSRCTRPYCENLIGGSDLTESLRTKVLDVLAPSMTRFLKPDPDIVHPPSGENAPVVSQANLTIVDGEFAPRSRIQVALLGRYGNTSIPNANALELSLLARGFAVKTIHLDHPLEVSLAQAAQLFRNQSILVAPQGDALGYSNWMAPGTVVVSILPRFARSSKIYTDRMMAFGKRFFAWDCRDDSCVQPDRDLAHECIEAIQDSYEQEQGISAQEFEEFANMKQDFRQRSAVWKAITDCYTRDVNRRLNVEELTGLIVGLAKDFSVDVPGADSTQVFDDSTLQRRAAAELDEEDEEELDKEELEQGANDVLAGAEDEEEEEDLDKEGTVRIQVDKETQDSGDSKEEGEEQEINVHEYDEQNPSPSLDDKKQDKEESIAATPTLQPWQPPKVTPLQTAPRTEPMAATKDSQEQVVRPMYGFGDFCRLGRCCGSAQVLAGEQVEGGGVVSAVKSLTPCAASMSAFVFGDKAVWGLTDGQVTARESQNLVWQVDLARSS